MCALQLVLPAQQALFALLSLLVLYVLWQFLPPGLQVCVFTLTCLVLQTLLSLNSDVRLVMSLLFADKCFNGNTDPTKATTDCPAGLACPALATGSTCSATGEIHYCQM